MQMKPKITRKKG